MARADGGLFPAAKFAVPPVRSCVDGHRVVTVVTSALTRGRVVSVVAPAGSGKSTLLAAWARDAGPWQPVWLRLDDHDDDPITLGRALAAAVRAGTGHEPARLARLLRSELAAAPEQVATALVNDLDDLGPVALVLDDLHRLRAEDSGHLLVHVIEGLGPDSRLLVASRTPPALDLPRLRVRGAVTEIDSALLRLDRGDIAALLADTGDDDPERVDLILERSGGWAAAAVLLAGAGPEIGKQGRLATEGAVDEYLRAEVLAGLGPDLASFALVTSLLPVLDPAACRVLTGDGGTDSHLDQLRRRGLTQDDGEGTARYLDRIGEFLRRELAQRQDDGALTLLRRRAAGLVATGPAVDLLLAAGDDEAAAALVVGAGRDALDRPGRRLPRHWLTALAGADLDPTSPTGAWARLLTGLVALEDGDLALAHHRLAGLPGTMQGHADTTGLVRSAYALAEVHLARGEIDDAAGLLDLLLDATDNPDEAVRALVATAWMAYFGPDWDRVGDVLEQAFGLALGPGRALGRDRLALGLGTEFLFVPQGPRWLLDRIDELRRRQPEDPMALASLDLVAAAGRLVTGQLPAAEAVLDQVDEQALELGEFTWLALMADRVRLMRALVVADHPGVDQIVDTARAHLDHSERHYQERGMYAYALARSGWLRGRADLVRAASLLLGPVGDHDRPDTVVTGAVVGALAARLDGDLDAAAARLAPAVELQRVVRFCLVTGLAELDLAAVHLAQGRPVEAVAVARPLLARLAGHDAVGIVLHDGAGTHGAVLDLFADDGELASFVAVARGGSAGTGVVVADTGERLTPRELEVLDLVAEGLSNRAIADRLYIGERTVKSHMTSIMRKLAVSSRTAAIARLRSLPRS